MTWRVLVLVGASGTGKSTAAAAIGRQCGVSWLQVDDLRLALEFSQVTLPERTDAFYYFQKTPDVWRQTPAELRQAFIDVAEIMAPAVRTVIHSHVITETPMIIEGDGILPAMATDRVLRPLVADGTIRFCCVGVPEEGALLANLVARGRGIDPGDRDKHRRQAVANRAFGLWVERQAAELGIPIVPSEPLEDLPKRILVAVT